MPRQRTLRRALAPIVLVALAGPALGAQGPGNLSPASWLAGCWEQRTAVRVVHEQWMAPLGGVMLGTNRTVVRDTARAFEFLRIAPEGGQLAYIAAPSGRPGTVFPVARLTDTLLVFENPAHDFPQRILYRRLSADSLVARIEGMRGGQLRGVDFPMRRVTC